MGNFFENTKIVNISTIATIVALVFPFLSKTLNMFISTIGLLDIEKSFISKNRCLLSEFLRKLGFLSLILYFMATASLLLYLLDPLFSVINNSFYYISLFFLLFVFTYLISAIFIINSSTIKLKLSNNSPYGLIYHGFHSLVHISWLSYLILFGATYVVILINSDQTKKGILLLAVLIPLCLLILFFHYLFLAQRKKFLIAHYKIKKLKTKDGKTFTDLYLYSYNDRHVFLGYTPNPIESKEHLVISQKELVDCYELERECYYWDKKIEEEHYLLLNKALFPSIKKENLPPSQ